MYALPPEIAPCPIAVSFSGLGFLLSMYSRTQPWPGSSTGFPVVGSMYVLPSGFFWTAQSPRALEGEIGAVMVFATPTVAFSYVLDVNVRLWVSCWMLVLISPYLLQLPFS